MVLGLLDAGSIGKQEIKHMLVEMLYFHVVLEVKT